MPHCPDVCARVTSQLWAKNAPHFGIAHALCLGLGPWLAAEIPHMVETGAITHKG